MLKRPVLRSSLPRRFLASLASRFRFFRSSRVAPLGSRRLTVAAEFIPSDLAVVVSIEQANDFRGSRQFVTIACSVSIPVKRSPNGILITSTTWPTIVIESRPIWRSRILRTGIRAVASLSNAITVASTVAALSGVLR
jgi:hypothetical protein